MHLGKLIFGMHTRPAPLGLVFIPRKLLITKYRNMKKTFKINFSKPIVNTRVNTVTHYCEIVANTKEEALKRLDRALTTSDHHVIKGTIKNIEVLPLPKPQI